MFSFISVKAHKVIVTVVLGVNSPWYTLHTSHLILRSGAVTVYFLLTLYRWTWIWSCLEVGWTWSLEPLRSALGALHPPPALTGKNKKEKKTGFVAVLYTQSATHLKVAEHCNVNLHGMPSFIKCLLLHRLKSTICLFPFPLPAGPAPPLLAASPVRWTVCCTRSSSRRALLAWEWHSTSPASSTHR